MKLSDPQVNLIESWWRGFLHEFKQSDLVYQLAVDKFTNDLAALLKKIELTDQPLWHVTIEGFRFSPQDSILAKFFLQAAAANNLCAADFPNMASMTIFINGRIMVKRGLNTKDEYLENNMEANFDKKFVVEFRGSASFPFNFEGQFYDLLPDFITPIEQLPVNIFGESQHQASDENNALHETNEQPCLTLPLPESKTGLDNDARPSRLMDSSEKIRLPNQTSLLFTNTTVLKQPALLTPVTINRNKKRNPQNEVRHQNMKPFLFQFSLLKPNDATKNDITMKTVVKKRRCSTSAAP